jgi:hypothetical protein
VVLRGELGAVLHGGVNDLTLRRECCEALLTGGGDFVRAGTVIQSATAAVVTDTGVVDDGDIVDVDIAHDGHVHAGDGAVIEERTAVPVAAFVTDAAVAVAVVDTAIEADVGAPVAVMKEVTVINEAPVAGGPESADIR